MKTIVSFLTGLVFLAGCHSSVNQEKSPEWLPPMTRTETAKSPSKTHADQYLAMKYFEDRPVFAISSGPLPVNEIDRAKAHFQAGRKQKKSHRYAETARINPSLKDGTGLKKYAITAFPETAINNEIVLVEPVCTQKPHSHLSEKKAADPSPGKKLPGAIEICNANGVRQMAKGAGSYLKSRGYNVIRLTNAGKKIYPRARIYYVGPNEKLARQIAADIPEIKEIKRIKKMDKPDIKVKVVLGKDLRAYQSKFREN